MLVMDSENVKIEVRDYFVCIILWILWVEILKVVFVILLYC